MGGMKKRCDVRPTAEIEIEKINMNKKNHDCVNIKKIINKLKLLKLNQVFSSFYKFTRANKIQPQRKKRAKIDFLSSNFSSMNERNEKFKNPQMISKFVVGNFKFVLRWSRKPQKIFCLMEMSMRAEGGGQSVGKDVYEIGWETRKRNMKMTISNDNNRLGCSHAKEIALWKLNQT